MGVMVEKRDLGEPSHNLKLSFLIFVKQAVPPGISPGCDTALLAVCFSYI